MTQLVFTKHHGLGNDFLIALGTVEERPVDLAALARRLCDRRTGIGADGLIWGDIDDTVRFILHNADGSRPEISGNGLRCFGQALALRSGRETNLVAYDVLTDAGPRHVSLSPTEDPTTHQVKASMGAAQPGPEVSLDDVTPVVPALRVGSVDVGNPHIVIEVHNPRLVDMNTVGPAVEAHFMPTGSNVHVIGPGANDGEIAMAIWERGVGVTQACGSGACAAAVMANRWGMAHGPVEVSMPGGSATVDVGDDIQLTGPSVFVGTVSVPE